MMHVHVEGGTNAGTRAPFEGEAAVWECACAALACDLCGSDDQCGRWDGGRCDYRPSRKLNPGYLVACPDCGERRPG